MKLCGKYLGDNDATCPVLHCIRDADHDGDCDNVRGDCPPHDAVFNVDDELVCDKCGVQLEIDPTCLGCIIDATGRPHFQAAHVCEYQTVQLRVAGVSS